MLVLPPEHPQRVRLSDEVHARPPPALATPSRITHVSCLIDPAQRQAEIRHVAELCQSFGVEWHGPQGNHFQVRLEDLDFTWERHGELQLRYTIRRPARNHPSPSAKILFAVLMDLRYMGANKSNSTAQNVCQYVSQKLCVTGHPAHGPPGLVRVIVR